MIFCVETKSPLSFPFSAEETGRRVAEKVLEQEGCPYSCGVSLLLTDDAGIRELNRKHRFLDEATDVLSFPSISFAHPADYVPYAELDFSVRDPETDTVWLGDLVISVERTFAQAEAFGHTVLREYAFLVAHSMLHLLGYDHETSDEDEEKMFSRQREIMKGIKVK